MTAYPYVGLVLLVDALACWRLTRLVTADTITAPLRARIYRWAYRRHQLDVSGMEGDLDAMVDADGAAAPRLATLVRCQLCASVWIAAGVVFARCATPDVWAPVAAALAVAAVSALLARLG